MSALMVICGALALAWLILDRKPNHTCCQGSCPACKAGK